MAEGIFMRTLNYGCVGCLGVFGLVFGGIALFWVLGALTG
jgi:hypothetical protein